MHLSFSHKAFNDAVVFFFVLVLAYCTVSTGALLLLNVDFQTIFSEIHEEDSQSDKGEKKLGFDSDDKVRSELPIFYKALLFGSNIKTESIAFLSLHHPEISTPPPEFISFS